MHSITSKLILCFHQILFPSFPYSGPADSWCSLVLDHWAFGKYFSPWTSGCDYDRLNISMFFCDTDIQPLVQGLKYFPKAQWSRTSEHQESTGPEYGNEGNKIWWKYKINLLVIECMSHILSKMTILGWQLNTWSDAAVHLILGTDHLTWRAGLEYLFFLSREAGNFFPRI
jgi:hypothetical protein